MNIIKFTFVLLTNELVLICITVRELPHILVTWYNYTTILSKPVKNTDEVLFQYQIM